MKQYTNKEQTQHLIELEFPKPRTVINEYKILETSPYAPIEFEYTYSIGELIEFLGNRLMGIKLMETYEVYAYKKTNDIEYVDWIIKKGDLINALYEVCVELKKDGAI